MEWVFFPDRIPDDPQDDPPNQLIEHPYFRIGPPPTGDVSAYLDLFDPAKTDSASDYLFNSTLLATFIPSKQLAMGGRSISGDVIEDFEQYEMQAVFGNGAWHNGYDVDQQNPEYWDHGDYKKIGLPYVSPLYQFFIQEGDLDQHE